MRTHRAWRWWPLRHVSFDRYVRRPDELQEGERALVSHDPYNWGDHWRWYIQSPRREFLGWGDTGFALDYV